MVDNFQTPFKFDITEEFNELKDAFRCEKCNNLFVKPVALNTCGHIQCDSCLDKKKLNCCICKCPYNEVDISYSSFTESIVKCIQNIECIGNTSSNKIQVENLAEQNFEIMIARFPMKRNPKGETALHLACKKGKVDKAEELIASGVDMNATDWGNWSSLHEAVQGKWYNCVELLLKNGALINIPGISYMTPLHEATYSKIDNITELLLKYGADKNAEDSTGYTPLDFVADKEKLEYFRSIDSINKYRPKVFVNEEIIVYVKNIRHEVISELMRHGVKLVDLQEYRQKEEVTHFIASEDIYDLNLLFGILKGIFVVKMDWINVLPLKILAFNSIPESYNDVIKTSIHNKLECKPRLFNGINFYIINHESRTKVKGLYLTKAELVLLIKVGGGKVVSRSPALRTVENEKFQPYHARSSTNLKECSNYIIFDENKHPELTYNMKELQHRSSKWLIECILHFRILD